MQKKIKVIFDKISALMALIVLSPIMVVAAIGIKCSNRGPIFYKPKRMGKGMQPITIYKFRTMKVGADKDGLITGAHDSRIFAWGDLLRRTKIDELPQLINVLNGTMSVIGPRPEDINIVEKYYKADERKTLDVLPGLACPGSIFNYTHGDMYLSDNDADNAYVNKLLHMKLALDIYYLQHWSIWYDIEIMFRTIYVILMVSVFKKQMPYPREYLKVFAVV